MTVQLLSASGVGKSVKKFVKECSTDEGRSIPRYIPDVRAPRPNLRLVSPLQYLENLLNGWKAVASSSGDNDSLSSTKHFSGRCKRSSEEQHREDMAALQTCLQWRDLHKALSAREAANIARHGEKMRKLRENLDSDRPKIGRTGTLGKSAGAMKKMN